MKKAQKILCLLLAALMLVSLAACNGSTSTDTDAKSESAGGADTNDKGEEVEKEVDGYDYGLRYQEWIMLNTHMLQKAYKKIEEQSKEMEEMKNVISFLFEKIERLGV